MNDTHTISITPTDARFSSNSIGSPPSQERNELSILLEKEITLQNALLNNRCEHIPHVQYLNAMRRMGTDELTIVAFRQLDPYINYESLHTNTMSVCKLCSYPLLCQHEIDFYTALESVDFSVETVDKAYLVRQRIINKFKATNHHRTGSECTEVTFTFYCKLCGGELGKSEDVIQAGIRTRDQSASSEEVTPLDSSIFSGIAHIVKFNMNQTIVPMAHQSITRLIFSETKSAITNHVNRANKLEKEYLELFIRYIAYVYACSSLIAIKVGKLQTSERILINRNTTQTGGVASASDIKADFLTAYKIIQANLAFKRVGVTEAKSKALLIHAFKLMNRAFATATLPLKASTALDRLRMDILTSPITKYALFIHRRHHAGQQIDPLKVVGVDLAKLSKRTKLEQRVSIQPSLFSDIYVPPEKKNRSDFDKYVEESYEALVNTVVKSPVSFTALAPVNNFIKSFEAKQNLSFVKLRLTPELNLPCENGREFDFSLTNFQIGYCLDPVRSHRWYILNSNQKNKSGNNDKKDRNNKSNKSDNGFIYICGICKLEKTKVSTDASTIKSNNAHIERSLEERMIIDAFFELYTLSCPVKNAHEYENGTCTQCGVHKEQLASMDPSYYDKYLTTYLEFRRRVTKQLLRSADEITATKTAAPIVEKEDAGNVDEAKLESLGTGLSKLFGHTNMNTLGKNAAGQRVYEVVESYVRLLYSHYIFARNLSMDTTCHPDMSFYELVKELMTNPSINDLASLPKLPEFPTSKNADRLLEDLFQILYDAASVGDANINKLLQFIVDKIITQESKHQLYNVGRLRTSTYDELNPQEIIMSNDQEDDEVDTLERLFEGYDMGKDDEEDNLNGEYE